MEISICRSFRKQVTGTPRKSLLRRLSLAFITSFQSSIRFLSLSSVHCLLLFVGLILSGVTPPAPPPSPSSALHPPMSDITICSGSPDQRPSGCRGDNVNDPLEIKLISGKNRADVHTLAWTRIQSNTGREQSVTTGTGPKPPLYPL